MLLTRAEEFFSFREAALDWSDPAGVHDMRVASRRLRSTIKDFRRHLPQEKLGPLPKRIKRLADALGLVRDEDVALALIEVIAAAAPAEISNSLNLIADERRARLGTARLLLTDALDEEATRALHDRLRTALSSGDTADEPAPPSAVESAAGETESAGEVEDDRSSLPKNYLEAGREIIEKRLAKLLKLSVALFNPSDVAALHDLRIASKNLRYALELFSPCWGGALRPFAKEISRLQTSLGEVHDCDVWLEELGERLTERLDKADEKIRLSQGSPATERRAALWLLRHFARRRAESYDAALARWHAWENFQLPLHIMRQVRKLPPAQSRPEDG